MNGFQLLEEHMEALNELQELLERQARALTQGDLDQLRLTSGELDDRLENFEERMEALGSLLGGHEAAVNSGLEALVNRVLERIQTIFRIVSANEALISRSLLVNRYCLELLTAPERGEGYGRAAAPELQHERYQAKLFNRQA